MPIYEYRCESCGHELEAMQKMSDEPLRDCPGCGKPQLKKLLSVAGFQLKGGGWHASDSRPPACPLNKGESRSESGPSGCGSGACGCG